MAPSGSDQQLALNLKEVSKSFGGIEAVADVNLQITFGESRALIGPNGAGKSTLFSLITGETPLDNGRIMFSGEDLSTKPVQRRIKLGMGRTYQSSNLFQELSVRENLFLSVWRRAETQRKFFSTLFKPWHKYIEQNEQLEEAARTVGLLEKLDTKVVDMSHGEHRQLELAMTLAHNPNTLLLDEPMAGLSITERKVMKDLIMSIRSQLTILLIEHDIDIAFELADKVSVLHQGRIIAEGTPDQIRSNRQVQDIYTLSKDTNGHTHA